MADYHKDNAVFLVYKDWESLFDSLDSNEEAGELIKALFAFAKRGEIAEFSGALKMAFIFMSQQLERDGQKWEETCVKRAEYGRKGGKAKAEKQKLAQASTSWQKVAKVADTDKDKETDTDTVTDKDTDKDISKAEKPQRHKHGEYQHVMLTDAEYQKLIEDFGESVTEQYIRKVDEYCEQSGKTYKNYNLVIRNTFMKRDGFKPPQTPAQIEDEYDFTKYLGEI